MLLFIDNFDSFSYILLDMVLQAGVDVRIVRNNVPLHKLVDDQYEGLIISPGPGLPQQAGYLMEVLDYYHDKLPILGVCLGHQAIGEYFGATLTKGLRPMHGKISKVTQINLHPLLQDLPANFQVTRYHSLELTNLPSTLETLLVADQGEIMALAHKLLPIVGVQYHPEAHLTEHGLQLISNWVNWIKCPV